MTYLWRKEYVNPQNPQNFLYPPLSLHDRGNTVVKVLCYKSEGSWFDPSWCQWIIH